MANWLTRLFRPAHKMSATAAPAAKGFEPPAHINPDRDPETVALLRSPDALRGRIMYTAQPARSRFSTYPGTNLEPTAIWNIQVQRNNGYPQLWADLCEQVLERDAHLGGIYETRRLGVSDKPFRLHIARQGDPAAEAVLAFTERVMDCIDDFDQIVEDLLSATAYGYAISELTWTPRRLTFTLDGKAISIDAEVPRVDWVPWKHVRFDIDTDEPYLWLKGGEYRIPPNKFIFHDAAGTGLIEKRGFMGACVWLSAAKRWSERDWLIYEKLFSLPFIHATYPDGEEEYEVHRSMYEQILKDFGEGIPALVPQSMEIKIGREASGRATDVHGSIIGWANTEMSKRILGSTLTVEVSGQGAWAAADTHRDAPYMRSRADSRKLAATLRSQLLRAIVSVNQVALGKATGIDPETLLASIAKCSWRIDREMSPVDRLQAWKAGVELGEELDADQFLDEYGFNRPAKGGRALKGKVVSIPSGGAVTTEGEIAKSKAPVTSPTADDKNAIDAKAGGGTGDNPTHGADAAPPAEGSESDVVAHPDESLNGAQVTALLDVIRAVGAGEIPKDAAKQLISSAFPISAERVNGMIDPIEVRPPADANSAAQQPPTERAKAPEKPSGAE